MGTALPCAGIEVLHLHAQIDPAVLFETLSKGSADSFALRNHGMKAVLPGEFPERAFSVRYARKDLTYALQLAREAGVDARGAAVVDAWFAQALDSGLGEQYHPVIDPARRGRDSPLAAGVVRCAPDRSA